MFRPFHRGCPCLQVVIERVGQGTGDRGPLDLGKDAQSKPSGGSEHPEYLVESGRPIRKKLQAELAKDEVEGLIGEGHALRASLTPLNLGSAILWNGARHRQ